jgi:hypothetical protein
LVFKEEIVLKECEVRRDAKEGFTQMNKNSYLQDRVRVEIN